MGSSAVHYLLTWWLPFWTLFHTPAQDHLTSLAWWRCLTWAERFFKCPYLPSLYISLGSLPYKSTRTKRWFSLVSMISSAKVIMVTSEMDTGGFAAPSVTVFPENGWREAETMEKCNWGLKTMCFLLLAYFTYFFRCACFSFSHSGEKASKLI